MGVPFIFVGVRQQNGCFDTHTFIQFSTYEPGATTYSLSELAEHRSRRVRRIHTRNGRPRAKHGGEGAVIYLSI